MMKKNKDQELLVVSDFFVEEKYWEERYKSLRKTIKNLKKFTETRINDPGAEA
jgi:sulfur transfer protein SufE